VVLENGTVGCFHDDFNIELIQYSDGQLVQDAVGVSNGSFGDQGEFCFYNTAGELYCGTKAIAAASPEISSGVVSVGRLGINGDYCAIADNQFLCGTPGSQPNTLLSPSQKIMSLGCFKEACCVVLEDGNLSCSSGAQELLSSQGNVSFFAGGDNNKCAVYDDGKAVCDGANWNGQLGLEGYGDQNQDNPTATFDSGMVATACGQHSACWLSEEGIVWCSGAGSNEAGSGGGQRYPTMIKDESGAVIENAVSITSGREFSCAALDTGELTCWGFGKDFAQTVDLNGVGVKMPEYCKQ